MENNITENQIQLTNGRIYNIVPLKVKYMLTNVYNLYGYIRDNGLVKLLGCGDGDRIVTDFLIAVLDSEDLAKEVLENLIAKDMTRIMSITKRLNELKDNEEIKNVQTQTE